MGSKSQAQVKELLGFPFETFLIDVIRLRKCTNVLFALGTVFIFGTVFGF